MAVFERNYIRKNRFPIFWIENNDYKTNIQVLRRAKKWTFVKGLVQGFCQKIELFLIGVFHKNHMRKDRF